MKIFASERSKRVGLTIGLLAVLSSGLLGYVASDLLSRNEIQTMRDRFELVEKDSRFQRIATCRYYDTTIEKVGRNAELDSMCSAVTGDTK